MWDAVVGMRGADRLHKLNGNIRGWEIPRTSEGEGHGLTQALAFMPRVGGDWQDAGLRVRREESTGSRKRIGRLWRRERLASRRKFENGK